MNIIQATRKILKMTQAEFGVWLMNQLGLDSPISRVRISEWENGKKHPRSKIRAVCAPLVALAFTTDLIDETLKSVGCARQGQALNPELACLRDDFKESLEALLGNKHVFNKK